jgi:phospholipid/cholesterol/gamma-HCH transport system substrate-binding protein
MSQPNQRQLLLGIFFIVALSILAFYTLFLTDIHVFSRPILMTVYFSDANGLREGDPVQFLGARVGRVRELSADGTAETRKRIRTVLSLDRELELLEDAKISIRESSLLGGRHVFIDPGTFGGPRLEPAPDGAYYGEVEKNPIASLGDLGTILNENRASIAAFIENLEAISTDIRNAKGLVGKLIADESLATDARAIVANVSDASARMKNGEGVLGALIYDTSMKDSLAKTFQRLERIGADLESQKGLLGALVYDAGLRDRVTQGIDAFANVGTKLDRGEGTMGRLLSDESLAKELDQVVANLKSASEDAKAITAQVRNGQGTLGKLLADDGLYAQAERAVALLSRSLEDYREAAPITSFTSVLFAAF